MSATIIPFETRVCTLEEAAKIEFGPIAEFIGADHEPSIERAVEVTRFAIDLLCKSKPELVEFIKAMYREPDDLVSAMLEGFRDGKGKLEAMLECVTAAQHRVWSAAATACFKPPCPPVDEAGSPR
jgi:hypothetical protein